MVQIDESMLKSEEQVIFKLRSLYRQHGFSCFKMSKFEEYDLYSQNKDFLVSDSVITFNDTNGKLMALKPDVTLSIVKSYTKPAGGVRRVYYNENVYRISEKTHCYKEIMQTGLEVQGELTAYNLLETVELAAASLAQIAPNSVLNISHLGILSAALEPVTSEECKAELLACIGEKNPHGVSELCRQYAVDKATEELLIFLTEGYGEPQAVIARCRALSADPAILAALTELAMVADQIGMVFGTQVRVDLSLVGDMQYYNGLIFRGFVEGVPGAVLRGGQYDKLMQKMGKAGGAVGFAVYLDLLERMKASSPYDVDVLLLYKPEDDIAAVHRQAAAIIQAGKSVSVQTAVPENLVYRECIAVKGGNGHA